MSACKAIIPEGISDLTLCLTGFTGYVGSHLLRTVAAAGLRPFLIGRPGKILPEVPNARCATRWDSPRELAQQLAKLRSPVVLNIAGHFISRHTPGDIPALVAGNLEYPLQIFEAVALASQEAGKKSSPGRIVNIGTSWEYSSKGAHEPFNLYAQLKAANAATLAWYARQSSLKAINLKLNDTYGGVDTRAKLMPLLKARAADGEPARLGAWAQRLNLLHITDVQEGLMSAALQTQAIPPGAAETATLMAAETITLGELTDHIRKELAPSLGVTFADMQKANPDLREPWLDAPGLPNWRPRISLACGMADYFGSPV